MRQLSNRSSFVLVNVMALLCEPQRPTRACAAVFAHLLTAAPPRAAGLTVVGMLAARYYGVLPVPEFARNTRFERATAPYERPSPSSPTRPTGPVTQSSSSAQSKQ